MSLSHPGGSAVFTADGVVGTSGKPIRVFNVTFMSDGTAGILELRNGTGASDTLWVQATGAISTGVTLSFESGRLFPNGCFFDKGTNVTSCVISFQVEG